MDSVFRKNSKYILRSKTVELTAFEYKLQL